jgi:hypothetical protein
MGVDSRATTLDPLATTYVTSESRESDWGQPPASGYYLTSDGHHLTGAPIGTGFVPSPDPDIATFEEMRLLSEFQAWEAASDEDWLNFEKRLEP